jgi:amidase
VAAALDATQGPDVGAPYTAPPPQRPFLAEVGASPGKLKIAYSAAPLMRGGTLDPECVRALEATVDFLRTLGHEVIESTPPHDAGVFAQGYLMRGAASTAGDVRETAGVLGRRLRPDDLEPETWALARLGESFTAADLDSANRAVLYQSRIFARYMEQHDVFLTPTLAKPPVRHGEFKAKGAEKVLAGILRHVGLGRLPRYLPVLKLLAEEKFQWVASTPIMNVTGQPSVSLPLSWSRDNLPIGMMFSARIYDEATLFRLAGQLEKERPWKDKRPPVRAHAHA